MVYYVLYENKLDFFCGVVASHFSGFKHAVVFPLVSQILVFIVPALAKSSPQSEQPIKIMPSILRFADFLHFFLAIEANDPPVAAVCTDLL